MARSQHRVRIYISLCKDPYSVIICPCPYHDSINIFEDSSSLKIGSHKLSLLFYVVFYVTLLPKLSCHLIQMIMAFLTMLTINNQCQYQLVLANQFSSVRSIAEKCWSSQKATLMGLLEELLYPLFICCDVWLHGYDCFFSVWPTCWTTLPRKWLRIHSTNLFMLLTWRAWKQASNHVSNVNILSEGPILPLWNKVWLPSLLCFMAMGGMWRPPFCKQISWSAIIYVCDAQMCVSELITTDELYMNVDASIYLIVLHWCVHIIMLCPCSCLAMSFTTLSIN